MAKQTYKGKGKLKYTYNLLNLNYWSSSFSVSAELDQNYIKSTADIFREILSKLNDIDTSSETLLQTISPAIIVAGLNATKDITVNDSHYDLQIEVTLFARNVLLFLL